MSERHTTGDGPAPAAPGPGEDQGRTIRVLRGNPTPEELAAALAVVRARLAAAASGTAGAANSPAAAAAWSAHPRTVPGTPPAAGPNAWRTSYWPA
ncbi:acyl-CoA carboxylase epsilon subunit [Streptomyces sp. SM14]|uniref:acyl-CoA carboxylase epsilon subunit n=1 Tax=Streptomyces sp. SM14 TaxID=1736045 RepID=UPI000CD5676C